MPFAPVLDVLLDLDLVLVTGKGGVGKTFLAAAFAHEAARVGARPLLVSLGPSAPFELLFGVRLGPEPVGLGDGIEGVALDPEHTVPRALATILGSERMARAAHRNRALRSFLDAAPGVPELAAWAAIEGFVTQREFGLRRFHPVVVDMDASGHAAMMLDVPAVLRPFAGRGPLDALVGAVERRLAAASTGALLVSLPAPLVVEETLSLYDALVGRLGILVAATVINRMPEPPLPAVAPARLDALAEHGAARDRAIAADLWYAHRELRRFASQVEAARSLAAAVDAPTATVPEVADPQARTSLARAGRALAETSVTFFEEVEP